MKQDVISRWLRNWICGMQIPTYYVLSVQIIKCWDTIVSTSFSSQIPSLEIRVPVDTYACRYLYHTKYFSKFMAWKVRPNSLKSWGFSQNKLVCPMLLYLTLQGRKRWLLFLPSFTRLVQHCVSLRSVTIMKIVLSCTLDYWRKLCVRIWERYLLRWIYGANVLILELISTTSQPIICSNRKDRIRIQQHWVSLGISTTYVSLDSMNGAILGKLRHTFLILPRSSAAASAPPIMKAMKCTRV